MFTFGDVRHAFRLLARSPIFSITAVVSLALGIAASTTIFSLIDALLIKPGSGLRNAAEVVDIGRSNQGDGFDNMSYGVFKYLKAHSQTLAGISAVEFGGGPMSLHQDGTSERVHSALVSASYFDVLGTRAALGRFFLPDDDAVPGERAVVVLTHAFWMQRLGGDPTVLDKPLRLNNRDFTVVGVAEPDSPLWAPTCGCPCRWWDRFAGARMPTSSTTRVARGSWPWGASSRRWAPNRHRPS